MVDGTILAIDIAGGILVNIKPGQAKQFQFLEIFRPLAANTVLHAVDEWAENDRDAGQPNVALHVIEAAVARGIIQDAQSVADTHHSWKADRLVAGVAETGAFGGDGFAFDLVGPTGTIAVAVDDQRQVGGFGVFEGFAVCRRSASWSAEF